MEEDQAVVVASSEVVEEVPAQAVLQLHPQDQQLDQHQLSQHDSQQHQCIQQHLRDYFFVDGHAYLLRGWHICVRRPVLAGDGNAGHTNFCIVFWAC